LVEPAKPSGTESIHEFTGHVSAKLIDHNDYKQRDLTTG
jgi:hypothetical protein